MPAIPNAIVAHSSTANLAAIGNAYTAPTPPAGGWSSIIGIVTALIGNVLISLALNTQRYAHIRLRRAAEEADHGEGHLHLHHGGKKSYGTVQKEIAEERRKKNSVSKNEPILDTDQDVQAQEEETAALIPHVHGVHSPRSCSSSDSNEQEQDEKEHDPPETKNYLKSPWWWLGITLMVIGEGGNFIAYGFAPASIVSPLGVVALVSNCLIAPIMLKEKFRWRDFFGVLVAVAGAVAVVLSAKGSNPKLGPDEIHALLKRWEFLTYFGITLAAIITLMVMSNKYGDRTIVIDIGLVGLFGGYTALSTKGIASLLSFRLFQVFTFPISYLLVAVLVTTAVLQIKYINRALQRFNSTQVIPTQFVAFTISVVLGSAIIYRDFERTTAVKVAQFLGGVALTFLGVWFITGGRNDDSPDGADDDEDDDCAAEEGRITLVDDEYDEDTPVTSLLTDDSPLLPNNTTTTTTTPTRPLPHRANSTSRTLPTPTLMLQRPHPSPAQSTTDLQTYIAAAITSTSASKFTSKTTPKTTPRSSQARSKSGTILTQAVNSKAPQPQSQTQTQTQTQNRPLNNRSLTTPIFRTPSYNLQQPSIYSRLHPSRLGSDSPTRSGTGSASRPGAGGRPPSDVSFSSSLLSPTTTRPQHRQLVHANSYGFGAATAAGVGYGGVTTAAGAGGSGGYAAAGGGRGAVDVSAGTGTILGKKGEISSRHASLVERVLNLPGLVVSPLSGVSALAAESLRRERGEVGLSPRKGGDGGRGSRSRSRRRLSGGRGGSTIGAGGIDGAFEGGATVRGERSGLVRSESQALEESDIAEECEDRADDGEGRIEGNGKGKA